MSELKQSSTLRHSLVVARYAADRAHELQLDVVTAEYETTYFRSLALLNGGSATAFITLAGANFTTVVGKAFVWFSLAMLVWIAGLVTAVAAGQLGYYGQKSFVNAHRTKRKASVRASLTEGGSVPLSEDDAALIELEADVSHGELERQRQEREAAAEAQWKRAIYVSYLSVILFVLGILLASIAVFTTAHS